MSVSEDVQKSFGFIGMDELYYLKSLSREIEQSPVCVLNIGAGPGTSGVGFAESRTDLILHTCDISDLSNPHGCLEAERDVMNRAGLSHKRDKTWFQHHMSSKKLAKIWSEVSGCEDIDLLFIDGDHTYEGCKADIQGFFPHVRDGGIIAIHDYDKTSLPEFKTVKKDVPGVTRAVNEIMPSIATYHGRVRSTVVYRKRTTNEQRET
jgi:predicted O-methyltransferase YrrM